MVTNRTSLADRHPRLYHMAEDGSLPGIEAHGLLSTSALLDLYQVREPQRSNIETSWRADSVVIAHPDLGRAVIRDQKPLRPTALAKCLLDGLTASDWYRLLNGKVFFWPSIQRVSTLLSARAYRSRPHIVLTLDTASLLSDEELNVSVSPINSGSAIYTPRPRGLGTFVPVARHHELRSIAEAAADYAVTDIMKHVVSVERRHAGKLIEVLR